LRIYPRGGRLTLTVMREVMRTPHADSVQPMELVPRLVAILIVLIALSVPVLLILWRLHRAFS